MFLPIVLTLVALIGVVPLVTDFTDDPTALMAGALVTLAFGSAAIVTWARLFRGEAFQRRWAEWFDRDLIASIRAVRILGVLGYVTFSAVTLVFMREVAKPLTLALFATSVTAIVLMLSWRSLFRTASTQQTSAIRPSGVTVSYPWGTLLIPWGVIKAPLFVRRGHYRPLIALAMDQDEATLAQLQHALSTAGDPGRWVREFERNVGTVGLGTFLRFRTDEELRAAATELCERFPGAVEFRTGFSAWSSGAQ